MALDAECKETNNIQEDSDSYSDDNSYDSDCEINVEHDETVKIDTKKQCNDDKYDKAERSDNSSSTCSNNKDNNDSYDGAFSQDQHMCKNKI